LGERRARCFFLALRFLVHLPRSIASLFHKGVVFLENTEPSVCVCACVCCDFSSLFQGTLAIIVCRFSCLYTQRGHAALARWRLH
jgi:hypothetical protein